MAAELTWIDTPFPGLAWIRVVFSEGDAPDPATAVELARELAQDRPWEPTGGVDDEGGAKGEVRVMMTQLTAVRAMELAIAAAAG